MPNLSNNGLSGLFIDGKEVKRASLGGKVFFEKHDYDLSLNSDKDILSYYDEDSATLTATLTDYNDPIGGETVLMYDSDNVSLATYYNWLNVFLFTVTSENKGEVIFDTTNAEHNNFYTEDTPSGGGYSNGGRVKFVITDTQVETWRYNSSTDTWTKSMMLYNLPVKIGFSYGTEVISNTAKIPFFAMGITDSHGECSVVYDSKGTGDLNIKCECPERSLVTEIYVEDTFYANLEEHINTGIWETLTSNITNLPTNFELTVDLFTSEVKQGAEQRLFLCPSSIFSGNSQPSQGVWVGFNRPGYAEYGYRNGSSNWFIYYVAVLYGQYHSFKIVKEDNTWKYYINGSLMGTKSYSNLSNYTDFTLCWINWNSGSQFKFKNLKIKPL